MNLIGGGVGTVRMPITANDIYLRLKTGDVTLAFDTSVTARRGFISMCEQVGRINVKRAALGFSVRIELCVPATAHAERLFDLAQEYGDKYDVNFVNTLLTGYQVQIRDFTVSDAEHCTELLMQRYGTPSAWYAFKKRRCLECVGLPIAMYEQLAAGTGQHCGAPNDWLIIAQASQGKMLLVMDDQGRHGEYDLIENMARYSEVRQALERVLDELISQSPTKE